MGQAVGNVLVVSNTHGQHDPASLYNLSVIDTHSVPVRCAIDADNLLVLKLRHHAIPEFETVSSERVEPDWNDRVAVLDPPPDAELFQSELAGGVRNVGCKTIRLEHHAFRHVRQPAIHKSAEDTE